MSDIGLVTKAIAAMDESIAELVRVCREIATQVDADGVRLAALERRIEALERRADRSDGVHGA